MMGRTLEEIEDAIIEAIRKGKRSRNDIRISAGVSCYYKINKYLAKLIEDGKIVEGETNIFDHPHVKKVYVLR